jgi:hypothetical protein
LWSDEGNWSPTSGPARTPDSADFACVSTGTTGTNGVIIRNTSATVAGIDVEGSYHCLTIESTGSLTLSGVGDVSTVECMTVGGMLTVDKGVTLGLVGTYVAAIAGGSVVDYGTITMSHKLCLYVTSTTGGTLNVESTGVFRLWTNDAFSACGFSNPGTITNSGEILKTGVSSTLPYSWITVPFNNMGKVIGSTGTILVDSKGLDKGATYGSPGARGVIELASSRTLAGHVAVEGTHVVVTGGWTTSVTADTLDVVGDVTWEGAHFLGRGDIIVHPAGTLDVVTPPSTMSNVKNHGHLKVCARCSLVVDSLVQTAHATLLISITGSGSYKYSYILAIFGLLGGRLELVNSFTPKPGETFTIVSGNQVSGKFSDKSVGSYDVTYAKNKVILVAD